VGAFTRVVSFLIGLAVLTVGLLDDPPHLGLVTLGSVLMGLISIDQLHGLWRRRP
jgi:hypothetical protein